MSWSIVLADNVGVGGANSKGARCYFERYR